MFYWKNILKGLSIALAITGVTFLVLVVIFKGIYGDNRYFFWGNSIVFFTFLGIVAAFFVDRGTTRKIQKETKDRYQRITWDHPNKINFYNMNRMLIWVGIWGLVIYSILYALDIIRLDLESITAIVSLIC